MVDRKARDKLAEELRHLVSGQLTNDEFDAAQPDECRDRAVTEIWAWGYTLYSSSLPFSYRLRRRYRLPADIRRIAACAVIFLHSDLEYEWPSWDGIPPGFWKSDSGCLMPAGLGTLALAVTDACLGEWRAAASVAFVAALVLCIPAHWLLTYGPRRERARRFFASGDVELWPFIRREDYEAAQHLPRLLGRVER